MLKIINMYIYSWGENLKEDENVRGDKGGWLVGR